MVTHQVLVLAFQVRVLAGLVVAPENTRLAKHGGFVWTETVSRIAVSATAACSERIARRGPLVFRVWEVRLG